MGNLITKIDNVVSSLMKEEITDKMQETLKMIFEKFQDKENWKNPTTPFAVTLSFSRYESQIQLLGLTAMSLAHFHGGYEFSRVGNTDEVKIYSKGYYHYIGA